MLNYFKRFYKLIPVVLTTLLCAYFINLFQRIDEQFLERQIDERNSIVEFTKFISDKNTLYTYLDIIDRFEDNNIYLLDDKFKLLPDKRHTRNCLYSIHNVKQPFKNEMIRSKINSSIEGEFTHKLIPGLNLEFAYRHLYVDGKEYILLAGIHNYFKTPAEKELHFAIGLLLLFTAFCNWIIIVYAKHVRYLCRLKNTKNK